MSRKNWFLFITIGLIWGIPYLLLKVSVSELSVPVIVCSRTFIGALILVPIAIYNKNMVPALKKFHYVLLYAILEMFLPWVLITSAEQKISSGLAGPGTVCISSPFISCNFKYLSCKWEWGSSKRLDWTAAFTYIDCDYSWCSTSGRGGDSKSS